MKYDIGRTVGKKPQPAELHDLAKIERLDEIRRQFEKFLKLLKLAKRQSTRRALGDSMALLRREARMLEGLPPMKMGRIRKRKRKPPPTKPAIVQAPPPLPKPSARQKLIAASKQWERDRANKQQK